MRIVTRSALLLNKLAQSQVAEHRYRILSRTLQQFLNGADTFAMQALLRFQPAKIDESVDHAQFLIGRQGGHWFGL